MPPSSTESTSPNFEYRGVLEEIKAVTFELLVLNHAMAREVLRSMHNPKPSDGHIEGRICTHMATLVELFERIGMYYQDELRCRFPGLCGDLEREPDPDAFLCDFCNENFRGALHGIGIDLTHRTKVHPQEAPLHLCHGCVQVLEEILGSASIP